MFVDLDLFNPTFTINCSELDTADEIYDVFRTYDIRHFSYVILAILGQVHPIYLKVGESAPNGQRSNKGQRGERIVRQIANLNGFSNGIPASSNGCDFRKGVDRLISDGILPNTFDKDNLIIAVWDLSTLTWDSLTNSTRSQSRCAEGQIAKQIKEATGLGTLLNIVDPERNKAFRNPGVSKKVFDSFFTIDDQ